MAASSIAINFFIVYPSALYFANVIKYTTAGAACQARGVLRNTDAEACAQRSKIVPGAHVAGND